MLNRRLSAALIALVPAAALLMAAPPASAGAPDLTCLPLSSETVIYDPPIDSTVTDTDLSIDTNYGPCTSTSNPSVTSGSRHIDITLPRSCSQILQTAPTTYTITWNTGQTSTITGTRTNTLSGAVLVVTVNGSVTAGLFSGDTVVQTISGVVPGLPGCLLGLGTVSSITGQTTLSLTSP
ncbi:hypothetical protein ACIPJK_39215 [Streptomyces roseus]|uniref:hypothetical protein n=1 Tax=Streptomyces roseus TaxID=66430 RepID=UPI003812BCEE